MRKLFWIIVIGLFALTGCTSNIKQETPVIKITPILPADTLLAECNVTKPPVSKADYVKLSSDEKESLLTDLSILLYGDLETCNKQLAGLRKWKQDIKDQYKP